MVIEMRPIKPSRANTPSSFEIFRLKSVPAHAAIGMKIFGPFVSIEDPDTFFFYARVPDLESREPIKAKFIKASFGRENRRMS